MATTRTAHAEWQGDLKAGSGDVALGSGRFEGPYTFVSRFESGEGGTNPEELAGAAIASCYAMFLANVLAQDGNEAESVRTEAVVELDRVDGAPTVTRIELRVVGKVPGIDADAFTAAAEKAKAGCPISKLYTGGSAEIVLDASLEG
ncbi:OsmC family peroxiredoxin [Egicoccus sp. AB-alg6-2]|uniref:OsmC family peroxiredoxin n=1 Tax=Egicoccus sp. AB-alg6-2 TaxID=3242692 RepID=UPI00359CD9B7